MEKGDKLDGRFEITDVVRETTDGTEYAAVDLYKHEVRIQELDVGKLDDWDAAKVFEQKARLLERLSGPGLPRYIDFFTDESGSAAGYFLAYSCEQGKRLSDIAASAAVTNGEELKTALISALHILDYLHTFSTPLVYGELTADMVSITDDGSVSICCTEFKTLAPGREASGDLKNLAKAFAGAIKAVYGTEDSPMKRELNEIIGLMIASGYESRPPTAAKLAEVLSREPSAKPNIETAKNSAETTQPYSSNFARSAGAATPIRHKGSLRIQEGYRNAGLRFSNGRVGKTESLVPQILLNLWLGKPWVIILIAAFLSGGPLLIPLLILHLYPAARTWMKKRYAKYCEVEVRVDEDVVSVPNQVDRTRIERIDRIEYLTYREENELRLEVTMTQTDGQRKSFYLAGISEEDAIRVRDFLNQHVE